MSALSYDSYLAVYNALKALDGKELNSVAIKDALKTVEFDGVTGHIKFDENGDAIKDVAFIKTISPESLQSKEFKFVKKQTV